MILLNPTAILAVSLLVPPAAAQYGSLSPDPFDGYETRVEEERASEPGTDESAASALPVYISLASNINDFGRFADGGSDSNWYIGFNNAWVVKLPPIPQREFSRAFIGAKIGRAKTQAVKSRPWERSVIPGKIYMAVSQRPSFSAQQSFFIAETSDIPLEVHPSVYMPGTGASEWFWKEVPLSLLSQSSPNYLIIWSPTREFRNSAHSPILAALQRPRAERGAETSAWNNHAIEGVPPRDERDALQVPISLKPALALKLVPAGSESPVSISGFTVQPMVDDYTVRFSVLGRSVELAWVELSQDGLEWKRVSSYRRHPPYVFSVDRKVISPRGCYLRGRARDATADEGHSKRFFMPGEGIR